MRLGEGLLLQCWGILAMFNICATGMFLLFPIWVCLKYPGVGKKKHSVFKALPSQPICISSPIFLNWELIMLTPLIKSSQELNMKAPSSRYRI